MADMEHTSEPLDEQPSGALATGARAGGGTPGTGSTPAPVEGPVPEEDIGVEKEEFLARIPSLAWRGLIYVVVIFLLAVLGWSYFCTIDMIVQGQGILMPEKEGVQVQALVGGEIAKVLVEEGAQVSEDQPLLELLSPQVVRELGALHKAQEDLEKATQELEVYLPARHELEQRKLQQLQEKRQAQEREIAALVAQQDGERETYSFRREEATLELEELGLQIASAEARLKIDTAVAERARKDLERCEHLRAAGSMAETEYEDRVQENELKILTCEKSEDDYAILLKSRERRQKSLETLEAQQEVRLQEYEGDIQASRAALASLENQITDLELALLKEQQSLQKSVELTQAARANAAAQVTPGLHMEGDRVQVRAPHAGTVSFLTSERPGKVIAVGDLLATLIPAGTPLVVELEIPNAKIAFVEPGLQANLKYHAYRYEEFGIQRGHVLRVGVDAVGRPDVAPEAAALANPSFRVLIGLEKPHILIPDISPEGEAILREEPLRPGLAVDVEIVTEERRLISVFLQPFEKLLTGGMTVDR